MRLAVIADDLTGAFDTGVQFRNWGLTVEVVIGSHSLRDAMRGTEIIVVDTETRDDPPERAYSKVRDAAERLVTLGVDQIYKKIDSTLRGNIGAELDAVMDITNAEIAFVAPAYPANGRTTVNGTLLINGVPINETEYAGEIGVNEAHIPTIIGLQSRRKVGQIDLNTVRRGGEFLRSRAVTLREEGAEVLVFDAVTEGDLIVIAGAARDVRIISGSAGLASELPQGLGLRSVKPVLTICGSIRSISKLQAISISERLGGVTVNVDTLKLIENEISCRGEVERCVRRASEAIRSGRDVVVGSALQEDSAERTISFAHDHEIELLDVSSRIEEALASITSAILGETDVSGLILTGGATALKVCEALQVERVEVLEEVLPGMPLLRLREGLKAITKAGGFGNEDSLVEATKYLRRASQV